MGSCQHTRSPLCPEAKVQVLRRTGVLSVLMWPQNFLSLTIRPEEAGGSCQYGRGPIFPEVYTGGPEEVSVLSVWTWPHILPKPHRGF